MSAYEFIQASRTEGIATLTLRRPPLNVLHLAMMAEMNAALESIASDASVAAVVIRAEGRAFCAGVDVADHAADRVGAMVERFHGIFRKLAATDALTIAAVQGAALGGGCELACFCDVVLASSSAKFGQPEVQVGVFPPVAACILPLRVGLGRAIELNALGATVDAHEALRIGLASHVLPEQEFGAHVDEYLKQVRCLSRPVVRIAKRATAAGFRRTFLEDLERAERLYLNDLMKLTDAHEGIAAFLEKRRPAWAHA